MTTLIDRIDRSIRDPWLGVVQGWCQGLLGAGTDAASNPRSNSVPENLANGPEGRQAHRAVSERSFWVIASIFKSLDKKADAAFPPVRDRMDAYGA